MRNIFAYLKDFKIQMLLLIVLLIIQAACDLALPSYTSDIVDVGIANKGIAQMAPVKVRGSQLEQIALFLDEDEQKFLYECYEKTGEEKEGDAIWECKAEKGDMEKIEEMLRYPLMYMEMTMAFSEENGENGEMQNRGEVKNGGEMPDREALQKMEMIQELYMPNTSVERRKEILEELVGGYGSMEDTMASGLISAYLEQEYTEVGINMEDYQKNYLVKTAVKMIGVAFVVMVCMVLVGLIAARTGAQIAMNLRNKVFAKVIGFSNSELDHFSTASLITRNTNDIQQVQMVLTMMMRMVFYAPILGIGGIVKVLGTNVSMSWIIVVAVAAIFCLVAVLFAVAMPKFQIMQKLVDRVNLISREILTGLQVIRAFSREDFEEKRFDKANIDLKKTQLFTNRVMTFMMPCMMLIMNCITVAILWFGAKGIDLGDMKVGEMMAFMTYTMQIVMSFLMLTMMSIMLPRAGVAAKRIDEVLAAEATIVDKENPVALTAQAKGEVVFSHVSFRYPDASDDVLCDIDFTAKPGETTAFIGSTGSGKSTLVNLIPRFYDVTCGAVTIDGIDIRDLSQKELRSHIGYVPQKGVLFSGTIESNIKFGAQELSEEEMEKAAEIAQADEFILTKEKKYKSSISQGGTNVSGGQKQRLSIARAIAKKPKIYIFDDSFSALDFKTDAKLRQALAEQTKESVVLIVAQRISTIMHAEQIIVLDEGKMVGKGTHEQLLRECEVYRQIAGSQLSHEELEKSMGIQNKSSQSAALRKEEAYE